jgi:hypothetical protein
MPASKDPVFRLAIRGLFFPLDECFAHKGMDRHRFLRALKVAIRYA